MKVVEDNVNLEELKQDSFSESGKTFGDKNQISILGVYNKYRTIYNYVCKCSECEKDPALYKRGLFIATKYNLEKGMIPCGCSTKRYWENWQYEVLVRRKCKQKNYTFLGFEEVQKVDKDTKVKVCCNIHNYTWFSTGVKGFLNDTGCIECGKITAMNAVRLTDEESISLFRKAGHKEDTVFKRLLDDFGEPTCDWEIYCPACAKDIYAQAGVADGYFYSNTANIRDRVICRCAKSKTMNEELLLIKVKHYMELQGNNHIIKRVEGKFKGVFSDLIRECPLHGEYSTKISNILSDGNACPVCHNQIQKHAYIHNILDNGTLKALKFGITNNHKKRIEDQNRDSVYSIKLYGLWEFPDIQSCKNAEKEVKRKVETSYLSKEQVKDGYTETCHPDNLQTIIDTYKELGGVLIS